MNVVVGALDMDGVEAEARRGLMPGADEAAPAVRCLCTLAKEAPSTPGVGEGAVRGPTPRTTGPMLPQAWLK